MHSGNPMQGATWVLQLMGLRDAEVTTLIDKNKLRLREPCSRSELVGRRARVVLAIGSNG